MLNTFLSSVVAGVGFSVGVSFLLLVLRFSKSKPIAQELQEFWNESLAMQERGLIASAKLNRSIVDLIEKNAVV